MDSINKITIQKITSIVLITIFSISNIGFSVILAQSSGISEIQEKIERLESEQEKNDKALSEAQQEFESARSKQDNANNDVEKIQAEISTIDKEITFNTLRIENLEEKEELYSLQKEELQGLQDLQVNASYLSWKTGSAKNALFGGEDPVKNSIYNEAISTKGYGGIQELAEELETIKLETEQFSKDSKSLQESLDELAEKKKIAQEKLNKIEQQVVAAGRDVSSIRTQNSKLQSQIEQLQKEQQEIQNQENNTIDNNNSQDLEELVTGEYYFSGTGRDLYQGHGVGMSQYGALGAALNGWDYKKIVEFYFPGTKVQARGDLPATINVDQVGPVKTEDYVAGLGEIPDYSCESLGREFNPSNFWVCWPEQAILAQIVIARNYGVRRSGFVYKDTRGQVYKGGSNKRWAANATANQVAVYNGSVADTYYSSDNSQGYGTANNDTVWSNFSGYGTPIPYLRNVNDSSFAYRSSYTNWGWRTNSYSVEEMDNMIKWTGTSSSVASSTRSFMAGVKSKIGNLKSISFVRDGSKRVSRIKLTGDAGSTEMAGWLFKAVWNVWVGNTGNADYIYSLTFFMNKK